MNKTSSSDYKLQEIPAIGKGVLSIGGCRDGLILGTAERTPAFFLMSFLSPMASLMPEINFECPWSFSVCLILQRSWVCLTVTLETHKSYQAFVPLRK